MDPIFTALINLGATGVMSAVFLWCWQKSDKERKEVQEELNDIGKRSIEADFTVAASMDRLTSSLTSLTNALTSDQRRP